MGESVEVSHATRPRIVITVQAPARADDPALAELKNAKYVEAVRRHGGDAVVLDETTAENDRTAAFAAMDGLLMSGGVDVDPAHYGEDPHATTVVEPERDRLEAAAFQAAEERAVPVFGICRGMQAINVFRGGSLVQDIGGHTSEAYPAPTAHAHPLAVRADSRLGRLLGDTTASVNTYHHQAVRPQGLGSGLRIAGTSPHEHGDLVEAVEDADAGRWLVGVQSHPERTESTPSGFESLWADFIAAAARSAGTRSAARAAGNDVRARTAG